ncbi:MAG: hypothetical protein PUA77_05195 [Lachnospiraceae bacterium]|nr:hypothetical protein [Agathobacter sp.]MDD6291171.1 hypothetical protein [Lachnospiraceae bacterium]
MKRFYKIAGNAESKPVRLVASLVLAFVVMLFINGFIGSMGGFPAFIAFSIVFFLLRTLVGNGSRMTHQLAMTSRREVIYFLFEYSVGYLILWSVFRIGITFSRVSGWGNISGASAVEFVEELLQSPLLEKGAYLFAGILMFDFVLSLFPLVVIRERMRWILYAIIDGACFALLCMGIGGACTALTPLQQKGGVSCLMDRLLSCSELDLWQELLVLAAIVLFTVAVGIFVFLFTVRIYGPKPGRTDAVAVAQAEYMPGRRIRGKRFPNFVAAACGIVAILVVLVIIFMMPEDTKSGYVKVAEFLTRDTMLGPMVYGGNIYVPVDGDMQLQEAGTPQGYLAEKDEDCDSRFYQMAVANLLYTDASGRTSYVQMEGTDEGLYLPVAELEQRKTWEQGEVFLLWDEDWMSESAYSHEPTGYTVCNEDLIEGLKMQFPQVTYRPEDFADYDAYFTIRSYASTDKLLKENTVSGNWVGCILVKDDKFYFGSYENQITGICLQQLRDVLGGNE